MNASATRVVTMAELRTGDIYADPTGLAGLRVALIQQTTYRADRGEQWLYVEASNGHGATVQAEARTRVKTYPISACASGCAFHTTIADEIGNTCGTCDGPLGPVTYMTRPEALDTIRHETDGRYAAGKAATIAWLRAQS